MCLLSIKGRNDEFYKIEIIKNNAENKLKLTENLLNTNQEDIFY